MKTQSISRRDFLKTGALATASLAATTPANLFAAESYGGNKIPFALQLYSVRDECAKDLAGTIAAVAKMGYKAVEFAGYHGRDAKTLRKLLEDAGLKCCGTHTGLDTLLGDNLPGTVEFNRTLGNFPHYNQEARHGAVGMRELPIWVRLQRVGNVITSYNSPDGKIWSAQTVPQTLGDAALPDTMLVGLAVSGMSGSTSTMKADNVSASNDVLLPGPSDAEGKE